MRDDHLLPAPMLDGWRDQAALAKAAKARKVAS